MANAQSLTIDPPPVRAPLDENGVNLATGSIVTPSSSVSIGGDNGLTHSRYRVPDGWRHNYVLSITEDTMPQLGLPRRKVQIGGSRHEFIYAQGDWIPLNGERGTLTESGVIIFYTSPGGVIYRFDKRPVANNQSYYEEVLAVGVRIGHPNGHKTWLYYRGDNYGLGSATVRTVRLQSVANNLGYQLKFDYERDTMVDNDMDSVDDWYRISRVTAINQSIEYCDPLADSCNLTNEWPSLAYHEDRIGSETLETVTDVLGRQARYRTDARDRLTGIKRPSETDDGMRIAYDADDRVKSITHQDNERQTYQWNEIGGQLEAVSRDKYDSTTTTYTDLNDRLITLMRDALGNETRYAYDADDRLRLVTYPEGNSVEYTRDAHGRVTQVARKAKPGSGLADIVTSTTYPALDAKDKCVSVVLCDKPTSTTDANGNVTNYSYHSSTGLLHYIDAPADAQGRRQRTTYGYGGRRYARVRAADGSMVQLSSNEFIYLLAGTFTCRTAATCSGSADELAQEVVYDNVASPNLHPVRAIRRNGDGSLFSAADLTYTDLGQVASTDGPLPGSNDTSYAFYDAAGQVTMTVGPKPSDNPTPRRSAGRVTYNADGQVVASESGSIADPFNESTMTVLTRSETEYDDFGRPSVRRQVAPSGAAQFSVAQYSYDDVGRLECTALRMNAPSTSTALPQDACVTMTPGVHGPDRITKMYYDAVGRPTEVWSGVDTPLAQRTVLTAYTPNGATDWIEDANKNRTDYRQDGFDRNVQIRYPYPSNGTPSGNIDEWVAYDPAGNIVRHTTRKGETFDLNYDGRNRLISKIVPDRSVLDPAHTRDVHYGYDVLGALTYARFDGANGPGVSFAYDAFGRVLTETSNTFGPARTITSLYDVAGRRTQLRYSDGRLNNYGYNDDGRPTLLEPNANHQNAIRWRYDDHGRLRERDHWKAAPDVFYAYDVAERLSGLSQGGSASSSVVRRTFDYNPAQQIVDETLSNATFAWDAQPDTTNEIDYDPDRLNRYASVDGTAYSYDNNGNLKGDGRQYYVYDPENRMVRTWTINPGLEADLYYDPLGRLGRVVDRASGGERLLTYDGDALVEEWNPAGAMTARYVHGVGAGDDPLIEYDAARMYRADAQHLYTDHLGSVIYATRYNGAPTQIHSYDEYGVHGTPDGGIRNGARRFGYTGQAFVPEAGLYYYKARMYSPTLGRFMQTDPIGYGDGMNLYRYVRNDPVNSIDPTGLACRTVNWTSSINVGGYVKPDGTIVVRHKKISGSARICDGNGPGGQNSIPRPGGGGGGGSRGEQPSVEDQITSDICEVGQAIEIVGDAGEKASTAVIAGGLGASALGAPEVGLPVAAAGGIGLTASGAASGVGQLIQDVATGDLVGGTFRAGVAILGGRAIRAGARALGDVGSFLSVEELDAVGNLVEGVLDSIAGGDFDPDTQCR